MRKAYDSVIDGLGPFFKTHLLQITHLPILEQYNTNVFIKQGVNLELIKSYADKFSETVVFDTKIEKLKKEIEQLMKKI